MLRGGAPNIFRTRKGGYEKIVGLGGGAPKICILQNQQERKIEPLARGTAKISSFEFQYLHPPSQMK